MPSYNVGPGAIVAAVRADTDGSPTLTGARWSLIPAWSGTDRLPYPTFNARIESAADRPAFRDAARMGRILVPMLGYYEWDAGHVPYWFHLPDDRPLLAAGLLSIWHGIPTCTILTRRAEGRCARVHDRMPVIIPPGHSYPWLTRRADTHAMLRDADRLGGEAVGLLDSHPVAPPAWRRPRAHRTRRARTRAGAALRLTVTSSMPERPVPYRGGIKRDARRRMI